MASHGLEIHSTQTFLEVNPQQPHNPFRRHAVGGSTT